jgi:hypothetical protein
MTGPQKMTGSHDMELAFAPPGDSIVGEIDGLAPVTLKIGDAE